MDCMAYLRRKQNNNSTSFMLSILYSLIPKAQLPKKAQCMRYQTYQFFLLKVRYVNREGKGNIVIAYREKKKTLLPMLLQINSIRVISLLWSLVCSNVNLISTLSWLLLIFSTLFIVSLGGIIVAYSITIEENEIKLW